MTTPMTMPMTTTTTLWTTSLALLALTCAATACSDDGASEDSSSAGATGETDTGPETGDADEVGETSGSSESSETTEGGTAETTDEGETETAEQGTGETEGGYEGPLQEWCSTQAEDFSFFVTSMSALWTLSGDPISDLEGGFGGDFGGLEGADAICQEIGVATGHGDKTWRAFLSVTDDGAGSPIHAIERIGEGPWYDANGRLVASGLAGLEGERPDGDIQSTDDLPDECGVPISLLGDAHDVPTGSDKQGMLNNSDPEWTCMDWTSTEGGVNQGQGVGVRVGHSFPREVMGGGGGMGGENWVSDHSARGCSKGANLIQNGAGMGTCIGCSGGYGALYCFAE